MKRKKGQVLPRFLIYLLGLLVMSFGIVLLIQSDLGASPWDVLHVGLYYKVGLTIGSWSIIVGIFILTIAAIIAKEFPQIGAFLNMVLIGVFIDMYLILSVVETPTTLIGKMIMLILGIVVIAYGMGIYISGQFGTGPRDSLMMALSQRFGWKVQHVKSIMELVVLFIGWRLGGPVFIGTVLFSVMVGPIFGKTMPQCQRITDKFLLQLEKRKMKGSSVGSKGEEPSRGAVL